MADRTSGEAAYPWLNEFVCDYVDGTMEPAARAMFEECLCGNPDLAAYVERLRATRQMLCAYRCQDLHAPCNLHQDLHRRIAQEVRCSRRTAQLPNRLGVASIVFATLLIAMVGGIALPPSSSERPSEVPRFQTSPAALPAFHADRSPLLPDTLPRSAALLRMRASSVGSVLAP